MLKIRNILLFIFLLFAFSCNDIVEFPEDYQPKDESFTVPEYEKIEMDRFPLDLKEIFKINDQAAYEKNINKILNDGMTDTEMGPITPYPNYFHLSDHLPSCAKWYISPEKHLEFSLPIDCYLEIHEIKSNKNEIINGKETHIDVSVTLHLSYHIFIDLSHFNLYEETIDEYKNNAVKKKLSRTVDVIFIPKDTVIGTTDDVVSLDFMLTDISEYNFKPSKDPSGGINYTKNPFFYFTDEVQAEILEYHSGYYEAMKKRGLFAESRLDRKDRIDEENSLYGSWFYKSGYFDLSGLPEYGWYYFFEGSMINMLNVDKTDKETFYKDINTNQNFGDDMIGVYGDHISADIPNHQYKGGRYMYFIEGDLKNGIIRLDPFFKANQQGKLYMKYSLNQVDNDMYNDILTIEFFDSLEEAQGDFTDQTIIYTRWNEEIY